MAGETIYTDILSSYHLGRGRSARFFMNAVRVVVNSVDEISFFRLVIFVHFALILSMPCLVVVSL
jgi:hypothetical protein